MKTYLALIRSDIRLAFRQRVVIFFNYLMPLIFFFIFAQVYHAEQGGAILQVVTMVTVIGTLGNGLFGAGMRAVQDRETNILRRFKVAPISPMPLLVASTVTGLVVYLPFILMMFFLARARYGMTMPLHMGAVLIFITLGVVALRSIGLILSSVVNSMAEAQILVQILYMAMLFLSGATFPRSIFPDWLLTVTQFIPSTWLVSGLQGIMIQSETLAQNWQAVGALLMTIAIGTVISVKLFRWEKEEKIRPAAKLWVAAVLLPFIVLGTWQASTRENVVKAKILDRDFSRSRTQLIRNARIFVGDGRVIDNGAVLVKEGKIAAIYDGNIPDPKTLSAEAIEGAGKTILPGLIDTQVHLDWPGGIYDNRKDNDPGKTIQRELAAYLYCGVTAVRSVGDTRDATLLRIRDMVNSGEKEGAELFLAGSSSPAAASYDPMLSAVEARPQFIAGKLGLLNRSLVQQVGPPELLSGTKKKIDSPMAIAARNSTEQTPADPAVARDALLRAYRAGKTLVTGTNAGSMLIVHGPTVQHEIRLWVEAGIPVEVALRAATLNAAELLGAGARIGTIEPGKEATLLAVDGNPLEDVKAIEAISFVMHKGERIDRSALFKPE